MRDREKTGNKIWFLSSCCLLAMASLALIVSCKTAKDPGRDTKEVENARSALMVPEITARNNDDPLIMAHYMPWYQAPPHAENYGWHWHMGYYDPWEPDENGKVQVASHYYPLTGPYDTRDPALIEYHLLTMKLAGIDGVIVDYYGIEDALDYKDIHESSVALFEAVKKAGMKFAVCYEDQSIGKMIESAMFDKSEALAYGQRVMKWMDDNWFQDESYLRLNDHPVLLNFGPQFFKKPGDWDAIFSVAKTRPYFIALDNHMEAYADSIYPWPPMWMSGGGELSLSKTVEYLNTFYRKTRDKAHLVAGAWPRFHDIYEQASVAESYGSLKDYDGGTLKLTLEAAYRSSPDIIQIATWNDHGEGTVIEPNDVYGYRDVEIVQAAKKQAVDTFPFTAKDLRVPLEIFKLRQAGTQGGLLDRIATAVFQSDKAAFDSLTGQLVGE